MGLCTSKPSPNPSDSTNASINTRNNDIYRKPNSVSASPLPDGVNSKEDQGKQGEEEKESSNPSNEGKKSPFFPFYSPSPAHYLFSKKSPARSSTNSTPKRFFRRPFPPPSPAKHIRAVLARRHGSVKPNEAAIPEGSDAEAAGATVTGLDKSFGFSKHFGSKYELGDEVGRGHFGYTCTANFKKGELKGQEVAVKVIPKAKMTTAIAIEDVRREVKILRALSGHSNLVQFYDAYEDHDNVYIVMEGGKYTEDDAKAVMIQILNVVAFCHLQGVVHRDLKPEISKVYVRLFLEDNLALSILVKQSPKPSHYCLFSWLCFILAYFIFIFLAAENFLFTSKDENSQLKAIDFGLSDFVKPDERLNDIVGSAYYVAPEVLHRSYSTEADVWSIGVIAYILLCGSRPFWARTESGIFRAVLKADPSFDEAPWPSLSSEARDFYNDVKVPLDILIFKLVKAYLRSSSLRKAALRALSKTLTVDELFYLKEQFALLEPNKNGTISLENIKAALMKNATDAMKDARIPEFLASLNALQYRRMDFDEFCAAALTVHQLEALDRWEQHARCAYEIFEKEGNRPIVIEELASILKQQKLRLTAGIFTITFQELGLSPSVPVYAVLHDWIRHTDGKL
ncbi:hypothetical protein Godav_005968, partial [Gossypium davidsonii]|nr:hypothetical protein [Gossypium davidsonii]